MFKQGPCIIGGEDLDNRFLSCHKGKRKTEEEKERGTSRPSNHQKRDILELFIIFTYFISYK